MPLAAKRKNDVRFSAHDRRSANLVSPAEVSGSRRPIQSNTSGLPPKAEGGIFHRKPFDTAAERSMLGISVRGTYSALARGLVLSFSEETGGVKQRKRTGSGDPVFNPKRRLRNWTGSKEDRTFVTWLAAQVKYTGNPAHKRNPGDFNLSPPAAPRMNATLCDDARIFTRAEALELLKSGALKGLVDSRTPDQFPFLIWAVGHDDIVFEAELENADLGQYHGYPMPLADPLRPEILTAARAR